MGYHRGSCTVRRTWIGCARLKTAQHFRKQGATKNLFGIDLFPVSHISSHLKWCKFSCNFATSDRSVPPGDGPGSLRRKILPHLKQLWRFGEPSVRVRTMFVVLSVLSADPQNRLLYDIQKHRKTLPPMPPLPRKWRPYWRCMKPIIVCQWSPIIRPIRPSISWD